MASIGAGSIKLPASRRFISVALRMCCYRSFREAKSRAIAASLLSSAINDPVVPDVAFSLPENQLPLPSETIRRLARGRPVIMLSPISYGKPGNWPTPNRALYDRYVQQMAQVLLRVSRHGYFAVVACSSLGDDETVIPDIMSCVKQESEGTLDGEIHFPLVRTWRDFVAAMRSCNYLIASRLHGTILGFVTQTPVVAISFDSKVDWVMEDLQQTDYLLHIRDFTADDVLDALDRVIGSADAVVAQIGSYRQKVLFTPDFARQYDLLAELALNHYQSHT